MGENDMTDTTPKPRKPRAPKRNFAKIVAEAISFCEASVDTMTQLEAIVADPLAKQFLNGKINGVNSVLARLDPE